MKCNSKRKLTACSVNEEESLILFLFLFFFFYDEMDVSVVYIGFLTVSLARPSPSCPYKKCCCEHVGGGGGGGSSRGEGGPTGGKRKGFKFSALTSALRREDEIRIFSR